MFYLNFSVLRRNIPIFRLLSTGSPSAAARLSSFMEPIYEFFRNPRKHSDGFYVYTP